MKLTRLSLPALLLPALLLTGCGDDGESAAAEPPPSAEGDARAVELRLGYFANVTHASAVYGVVNGDLQEALGDTTLETSVFNAGPSVIEALASGDLDASFIGPNPAINGFVQTGGELLRIVAGTTSGGAALVTRPDITRIEDLEGSTIATPQLGNTQDVAAKAYFAEKGVDVDIVNQENATTLDLLSRGQIDGGWVPEPWASRLVLEGGGAVLLDEADLWPDGRFVTTHLVVRKDFLDTYPGTVDDLLRGLLAVTEVVSGKDDAVKAVVNRGIEEASGRALAQETIDRAFENLTPTLDPVASSLAESAKDAQAAGLLPEAELDGIYDLSRLNALLRAAGEDEVDDAGLGA
jgi:NitT/TauT family transport system substrate-binding protein